MASTGSSYGSTQQPSYRVTAQALTHTVSTIVERQDELPSAPVPGDQSLGSWTGAQMWSNGHTQGGSVRADGVHDAEVRVEMETHHSTDQISVDGTSQGVSRSLPPPAPPEFARFAPLEIHPYPLSSSSRPSSPYTQSMPSSAVQLRPPHTTWATLPASSPASTSSRPGPQPIDEDIIEEDELQSSVPAPIMQSLEDGPSIPSPPDSPIPQKTTSPVQAKHTTPAKTRSSAGASIPPTSLTPSKKAFKSPSGRAQQPITTYSPKDLPHPVVGRARTSVSPTRQFGNGRSPIKRATSAKSRHSEPDGEQDSFEDNYRPRPRQFIEQMMSKTVNQPITPNIRTQNLRNSVATVINEMAASAIQVEPDFMAPTTETQEETASHPTSSRPIPPPSSSEPVESVAESAENLFADGEEPRQFAQLDSSAPQPSPESLGMFAGGSTQNYGYDEPASQTYLFTATQAASQRSESTQHNEADRPNVDPSPPSFHSRPHISLEPPSNPRVPAYRQLSRSSSRNGHSVPEISPVSRLTNGESLTSDAPSSRVSSNRRLQRANPRLDEEEPKRLGMTRGFAMPRSAPVDQRAGKKALLPANHTAPERVQEIEPTQIDESAKRISSPAQQEDVEMGDTFVDAAPPSPPHNPTPHSSRLGPVVLSSPVRPLHSSPPPTPLSESGPLAVPQQEMTDRSLPQPAPPKIVSPKRYLGKRRTRRSSAGARSESHGDDTPQAGPSDLPPSKRAKVQGKERRELSGIEAKRRRSESSDDSGTTIEDPEDNTYRPSAQTSGVKLPTGNVSRKKSRTARQKSRLSTPQTKNPPAPNGQTMGGPSRPSSKFQAASSSRSRATSSGVSTPVSSAALQPPFRVLGRWSSSAKYYVGTVIMIDEAAQKPYHVVFDDGYKDKLISEHLRVLELRKGDKIRAQDKHPSSEIMTIAKDWRPNEEKVEVEIDAGDPYVLLSQLYVTSHAIKSQFEDRKLEPGQTNNRLARDGLKDRVFLITSNGKHSAVVQDELCRKIERHGGTIAKNWQDLFDRSNDGFSSTLTTKQVPFLMVEGVESMKPKMVAALAAGIPCLSREYIDDAIERSADWREYIIASGKAIDRQFFSSQAIDYNWGESGWDVGSAQRIRRPFTGKSFVFLRPRSTTGAFPEVRALVPFCLHAMGAESLEQVDSPGEVDIGGYDIVVVEDRDVGQPIPNAWKTSKKLANFIWLKQCIIIGGLLPPALMKENGKR